MANRAPSHTKKGPGRRHKEGEPSFVHPERHLYGSKLARKAFRGHLARSHLGLLLRPQ